VILQPNASCYQYAVARIDFSCSKPEEGSYDKVRQVTKQETLMDQDREITREELHQLVWSKPSRTLAREFGLSDVGLAKICRKLGVKKPPRGFWAKVVSGMRIKKPPLGEREYLHPTKQ
jgi:hypothetical protein